MSPKRLSKATHEAKEIVCSLRVTKEVVTVVSESKENIQAAHEAKEVVILGLIGISVQTEIQTL